jgi:hypothetical protein
MRVLQPLHPAVPADYDRYKLLLNHEGSLRAAPAQEAGKMRLRRLQRNPAGDAIDFGLTRSPMAKRDEARELLAPVYGWFTEGSHRRGNAFARFDLGPDQRGELRRPQPARYSGSAERASSLLCGARTRAPQRNRRCPARANLWHQKIASAGHHFSAASNSLRGAAGSAR